VGNGVPTQYQCNQRDTLDAREQVVGGSDTADSGSRLGDCIALRLIATGRCSDPALVLAVPGVQGARKHHASVEYSRSGQAGKHDVSGARESQSVRDAGDGAAHPRN